jgi:hypothetical protein
MLKTLSIVVARSWPPSGESGRYQGKAVADIGKPRRARMAHDLPWFAPRDQQAIAPGAGAAKSKIFRQDLQD